MSGMVSLSVYCPLFRQEVHGYVHGVEDEEFADPLA